MKTKILAAAVAAFGRRSLCALALFLIPLSAPISAGTVTVFGDINSTNGLVTGIPQMYQNLLGGGTNVLVSKQNTASYDGNAESNFFNGLSGVTSTRTTGELSAANLAGVDLLFLNLGCCSSLAVNYSTQEVSSIVSFISGGGNVGIIAEPCCGTTPTATNSFLTSLGLSMQFGTQHQGGGAGTIVDSFIGAGVTSYSANTFQPILGGTAVAVHGSQGVSVAYETINAVPVPASLPLLAVGLGGLGLMARRKRKAA